MTGESDHIVAELAARIFLDLGDQQTINRLDDGAWKAPNRPAVKTAAALTMANRVGRSSQVY
jgi:hypothetical protein